jgi:hypothetical protein
LILLEACRFSPEPPHKLQGEAPPPSSAPPVEVQRPAEGRSEIGNGVGEPAATSPPQPVAAPETRDVLRDPRERHLRHVRQLTAGGRVAYPIFAADGQSLVYLKDRGGSVQVLRFSLATKKEQPIQIGPSSPFSLSTAPSGAVCLSLAPPSCKLAPLSEPYSALHCTTLTTTPVPGMGACPQVKPPVPSLPCAFGSRGERACPVLDASGATLLLYPADGGLIRPLDQGRGVDVSPVFSSDGTLLAWLSTRPLREFDAEAPLLRLQILEVAALPTAAHAIGPDQVHAVDPVWFPGKHRLVFASTADDAAGQDYDLFLLEADGSGFARLTFSPGVDRFPAVSPDGSQIAWVSERNFSATGDQDLFIADWVE